MGPFILVFREKPSALISACFFLFFYFRDLHGLSWPNVTKFHHWKPYQYTKDYNYYSLPSITRSPHWSHHHRFQFICTTFPHHPSILPNSTCLPLYYLPLLLLSTWSFLPQCPSAPPSPRTEYILIHWSICLVPIKCS